VEASAMAVEDVRPKLYSTNEGKKKTHTHTHFLESRIATDDGTVPKNLLVAAAKTKKKKKKKKKW
jgi:uncharacterized protein (UPF0147 family)